MWKERSLPDRAKMNMFEGIVVSVQMRARALMKKGGDRHSGIEMWL